jgi:DNA-binding MarR family transcriptional regulator
MPSRKYVQNTPMKDQIRALHEATLEVMTFMNRRAADEALVREAGVSLDSALFRLLVVVERFGPIGVVDLADRAGRDYTTVSRQVAKLEELGLVERRTGDGDRRVREAVVTAKGQTMTDMLDAARQRLGRTIFATWSARDLAELTRLMRRFAGDAAAAVEQTRKA